MIWNLNDKVMVRKTKEIGKVKSAMIGHCSDWMFFVAINGKEEGYHRKELKLIKHCGKEPLPLSDMSDGPTT